MKYYHHRFDGTHGWILLYLASGHGKLQSAEKYLNFFFNKQNVYMVHLRDVYVLNILKSQ